MLYLLKYDKQRKTVEVKRNEILQMKIQRLFHCRTADASTLIECQATFLRRQLSQVFQIQRITCGNAYLPVRNVVAIIYCWSIREN